MTFKEIYARQRALSSARYDLYDAREQAYYDTPIKTREQVGFDVDQHPMVRDTLALVQQLETEVAALQEEVGGKVFRVANENLSSVEEKIAKLNKRASKLGVEEVTVTVTDEVETESRLLPGYDPATSLLNPSEASYAVYFTYVVVNGRSPKLEGWTFVATLDHDTATDRPAIRRGLTETAQGVDLDAYRFAENRCDHCGFLRQRLKTYIVVHEDGRVMQVGSTCVKDFLGGQSPEQIARYAEWLADLDVSIGEDEDWDWESGGGYSGAAQMSTQSFVTYAATLIRTEGWRARWYEGMRETGTADEVLAVIGRAGKRAQEVRDAITEEDVETSRVALEWLREDVAKREEQSEFEANMVAYASGEWMTAKAAGIVAYLPMMHTRFIEGEIKRERAAKVASSSEWLGEIGDRVKLAFTVTFTRGFEGHYGIRYLTKGVTPDGSLILWWGSGRAASEMEQGETVECTATIKKHDRDSYAGDAKVTEIGNVRSVKVIEEEEASSDIEVQKTAEERAMEREIRERREEERRERNRIEAQRIAAEKAAEAEALEDEAAEEWEGVSDDDLLARQIEIRSIPLLEKTDEDKRLSESIRLTMRARNRARAEGVRA